MADIATIEEADAAAEAGADFVLSTMRGFTGDTLHLARKFEPGFIAELVRRLSVPVIAEGRIWSPGEARAAMNAGAWAVVVGTAITRPHEITRRYAEAVSKSTGPAWVAAIDVGATNIKSGLVSPVGDLAHDSSEPTPQAGADAILARIRSLALGLIRQSEEPVGAVAIATAGWVDASSGAILHATANLAEWTGTPIRAAIAGATGLPVFVENDAVCAAAGEWVYGEARGARNALCITLGTGIGCGAVVEGRLLRGAHGLANMLGHIPLAGAGEPCTCGLTGCFEASAGQAGLSAIAGRYKSLDAWAAAARGEETAALEILREYAGILAQGLLPAIHLLDPEIIVFSGGITSAGPALPGFIEAELARRSLAFSRRRLSFRLSSAGAFAGVRGAAAVARLSEFPEA
jgi:predicted NBD/HSP70 family sugar kinase